MLDIVVSNISDMVILLDKKLKIVRVNDRFEDITGYTKKELINVFIGEIVIFSEKNNFFNEIEMVKPFEKKIFEIDINFKNSIVIPLLSQ